MKRLAAKIQDCNDQSLIERIDSLHQLTLADGTLICQICNEKLTDGDEIICHLQRPAGKPNYDIVQIRCSAHSDSMESLLTLGTDELLVAGQVGRCSNRSTYQSWPVLLSPDLQVVSSAATSTAKRINTLSSDDDDPADSLAVGIDHTAVESSTPNRQETTLARWDQSTTSAEGTE